MKKIIAFLGFLLIIGLTGQASAAVINGSFEDTPDFDGWSTSGSTAVNTWVPWDIDYYATHPTTAPPSQFAELITVGSISQDLSWTAGETISFDWAFLVEDGTYNQSAGDNVIAYFSIFDAAGAQLYRKELAKLYESPTGSQLMTPGTSTDWQYGSYTFGNDLSGGSIEFSIDTIGGDGAAGSELLIDNVAITAVPEPASVLLLGSGLLVLAGARRKSRV